MKNNIIKLKHFYWENGRMPSYSELAKLFGYKSKYAALYKAKQLIEAGVIKKDPSGRLLPGKSLNPVKILATVQAGFPSPAEEENVDAMSLDEWLINKPEATFMLTVSGDSMIEAGINPGDTVLLERGRTPKTGDVVVAEVDGAWTIKFFSKKGSQVQLLPANKKYKPIIPQEELKIGGVVTAVIRKY